MEDNILAEGAQIIWVLEADTSLSPGTAIACRNYVDGKGSEKGICVGDGETAPFAGIFDDSPFSVGRGFDMIVRRSDMEIVFASSHGSPGGNDNYSGADLWTFIQMQKAMDQ